MERSETNQSVARKKIEARMSVTATIAPDSAAEYARRLYRSEYGSWGDEAKTLEKIGRWVGMSARSVKRLIKGETKTESISLYTRFRRAYIEQCERQLAILKHELEIERNRNADALDEDFLAQVQSLAEKVAKAKALK